MTSIPNVLKFGLAVFTGVVVGSLTTKKVYDAEIQRISSQARELIRQQGDQHELMLERSEVVNACRDMMDELKNCIGVAGERMNALQECGQALDECKNLLQ